MDKKEILERALKLSPEQRLAVVEDLLRSLDDPDPELDKIWAEEALRRLDAYRAGKIKGYPFEAVLEG